MTTADPQSPIETWLANLPEAAATELRSACVVRTVPMGTVICQQEDALPCVVVLLIGSAIVHARATTDPAVGRSLGASRSMRSSSLRVGVGAVPAAPLVPSRKSLVASLGADLQPGVGSNPRNVADELAEEARVAAADIAHRTAAAGGDSFTRGSPAPVTAGLIARKQLTGGLWARGASVALTAMESFRRLTAGVMDRFGPAVRDRLVVGTTYGGDEIAAAADTPFPPGSPATVVAAENSAIALVPWTVYRRAMVRLIAPLSLVASTQSGLRPGRTSLEAWSRAGGTGMPDPGVLQRLMSPHPLFAGLFASAVARLLSATTAVAVAAAATLGSVPAGTLVVVIVGGVAVGATNAAHPVTLLTPGDSAWGGPAMGGLYHAREPSLVLLVPATKLAEEMAARHTASAAIPAGGPAPPLPPVAAGVARSEAVTAALAAFLAARAPWAQRLARRAPRLLMAVLRCATVSTHLPPSVLQGHDGGGPPRAWAVLSGVLSVHARDSSSVLDDVAVPAVLPHGPLYRLLALGDVVGESILAAAYDAPLLPLGTGADVGTAPVAAVAPARLSSFGAFDDGDPSSRAASAASRPPRLAALLDRPTLVVAPGNPVTVLSWAVGDVTTAVAKLAASDAATMTQALALYPRLTDWPPSCLAALVPRLTHITFCRGDVVATAGVRDAPVYFLRSGVAVMAGTAQGGGQSESPSAPGDSAEVVGMPVGRDDTVNFLTGLTGDASTVTVTALAPCEAWVVAAEDLRRLAPPSAILAAKRETLAAPDGGAGVYAAGVHNRAHTDLSSGLLERHLSGMGHPSVGSMSLGSRSGSRSNSIRLGSHSMRRSTSIAGAAAAALAAVWAVDSTSSGDGTSNLRTAAPAATPLTDAEETSSTAAGASAGKATPGAHVHFTGAEDPRARRSANEAEEAAKAALAKLKS